MRIKTALILCAGFGSRLNPLTLKTPKPLLKLNDKTMLEVCINLTLKLGVQKIFINTFHLGDQISKFIENKKFPINIQIIKEENEILNTGGGILNLINYSDDNDFIYIGGQILNKSLFKEYRVSNFSITKIWDNLRKENKLNGFQSKKNFII